MSEAPRPLLELKGVDKSFGGLAVIQDLDLHVNEREIVSVIGPNGAGKTTLFNVITRLYQPDSGGVSFAGENLLRTRAIQEVEVPLLRGAVAIQES